MYCKNCGKEIKSDVKFCSYCGTEVGKELVISPPQEFEDYEYDDKSGGFALLCFIFPIVGLILFLVWKDNHPLKASSCGKGALYSVLARILWIIYFAIFSF